MSGRERERSRERDRRRDEDRDRDRNRGRDEKSSRDRGDGRKSDRGRETSRERSHRRERSRSRGRKDRSRSRDRRDRPSPPSRRSRSPPRQRSPYVGMESVYGRNTRSLHHLGVCSSASQPPRSCFKCGDVGHIARDCSQPSTDDTRKCHKCGEGGHLARDCTQPGNDVDTRKCHKCGKIGHISRECKEESTEFSEANMEYGRPWPRDALDANGEPVEKEMPNYEKSGKLLEETNTFKGVVLKYSEPEEARKPKVHWRLYPFKGKEELPILHIHRQSAFLLGRERRVADIPLDHPSCSQQHAVIQFRLVPFEREDGTSGRRIRPYVIDLGSSNGTLVNGTKIEAQRYYELKPQDCLKFGFSSREYVVMYGEMDTEQEE